MIFFGHTADIIICDLYIKHIQREVNTHTASALQSLPPALRIYSDPLESVCRIVTCIWMFLFIKVKCVFVCPQDNVPPLDVRVCSPGGQICTLTSDLIQKWTRNTHGRLSAEITKY